MYDGSLLLRCREFLKGCIGVVISLQTTVKKSFEFIGNCRKVVISVFFVINTFSINKSKNTRLILSKVILYPVSGSVDIFVGKFFYLC